MPPIIALIATSFLVIIILIVHVNQNRNVSAAIWIPTLWLLYSTSKQMNYWFNVNTNMEMGSIHDRIFLIFLATFAFLLLKQKKIELSSIIKIDKILFILTLYLLVSVFWAPSIPISLRRFVRDIISLVIVTVIRTEKNPMNALHILFKRTIYIALPFSIMLIKYFPTLGRQYSKSGDLMWTGIAPQKNELALFCAFSIVFLTWSLIRCFNINSYSKLNIFIIIDVFMLFLAIHLFLGPQLKPTYSATSLITLISALILFLFRLHNKRQLSLILLSILIIIGILLPFLGLVPFFKWIPEMLGRTDTLTGRTRIWSLLVPYVKSRFLFGSGFGSFWTTKLRQEIAVTAHNGYLDTILNIGIIGLLFYILLIRKIAVVFLDRQEVNNNFAKLGLTFTFMLVIHNYGESSIGYFSVFPFSLLLLFYFSFLSYINDDIVTNDKRRK